MIVSDERVARFVSARLGIAIAPPYTCLGTDRDGEIINGAIFHCFEGPNIHATVAGKGWTRAFLEAVGLFVFTQLGCLRITATTEREEVVKLACRLGGQVEGLMRDQFGPGRDGWIIGILKDEWRY